MIRVIDRTLVITEAFNLDGATLCELASLLYDCGANFLEVTPAVYEKLYPFQGGQYILRIQEPEQALPYLSRTNVKRFVCKACSESALRVYPEIKINDIRDFFTVERFRECDRVRVCGLADSVLQPMNRVIANLRSAFEGTVEFSADNDCYSATSLALQWAMAGGSDVVTSFFGMDNMASFEDLTRLLFYLKGRRAKSVLGKLKQLENKLKGILMESESA